MRILYLLSFLLCINAAFGQTEFSLYRLHNTLPQSNMLNPAFAPRWKLVIGLPVISSMRFSADMDGISFADIVNNTDSSLVIDSAVIANKSKEVNHIRFNQSLQLLYIGKTFGKSYVSIGLHEVSELRMNYPGDLLGWVIRGPGHPQYVGKPLDLGGFYGKGMAYNKASISLGRSFIGDRLRLGARFSYLMGLGMAESTKLSGQLIVGIDSVTVQTGDAQINTSGIDFFTSGSRTSDDYVNFFVKTGNKGIAWDFGATYQITKRLSINAAVNDLGFITWKDYTKSYHLAPVTYTFKGIDFLDYYNNSGSVDVNDEIDSLKSLFTPTETTGEKFTSSLIGKVYAGINYHVLGVNNLSALVYFDLLDGKLNPALSVGYTMQLGRMLNATVGATFQNGKIDNIGAGLALRLFKFQIFATSDRAQSIVFPARASRADIHAGLNLVFGKPPKDDLPDKDKKEEALDEKAEPEDKKEEAVAVAAAAAIVPAVVKKDSVIQDTPKEEVAAVVAPVVTQQETPPPVVEQQVVAEKPAEEKQVVVTQGAHPEELHASHFVVVGTFGMRANAERYSRELRQKGFDNKFGYASEKSVYYVYVYQSTDLNGARVIRDRFRKKGELQLPNAWVLSVVDGKFK